MNKQTLHIAAGAACSTDSAKPVSVSRMPWDTPLVVDKRLTGKVSHQMDRHAVELALSPTWQTSRQIAETTRLTTLAAASILRCMYLDGEIEQATPQKSRAKIYRRRLSDEEAARS